MIENVLFIPIKRSKSSIHSCRSSPWTVHILLYFLIDVFLFSTLLSRLFCLRYLSVINDSRGKVSLFYGRFHFSRKLRRYSTLNDVSLSFSDWFFWIISSSLLCFPKMNFFLYLLSAQAILEFQFVVVKAVLQRASAWYDLWKLRRKLIL